MCLVSHQAVGGQTVGSVHLRRRGGALQPRLLQVRRVLPAADAAVAVRHEPRGPAGGRLRRRRHGAVRRRDLPAVLHGYGAAPLSRCRSAVRRVSVDRVCFCFLDAEAIPLMVRVIQAADSRVKENVNATENCISAVGKVMRFRPECVNVNEIDPSPLAQLAAAQRGQRGGRPHV